MKCPRSALVGVVIYLLPFLALGSTPLEIHQPLTVDMDTAIRPGDDFFSYSNGRWLARTAIPDNRQSVSVGDELDVQARTRVRSIIEDAAARSRKQADGIDKIGDMYTSFMDKEKIEALGLEPARAALTAIERAKSVDDIARQFAVLYRDGANVPFHIFVQQDLKAPTRFVATIAQGGLGLRSLATYTDKTDRAQQLRAKYLEYIATILRAGGYDHPQARAASVLDLETRLASVEWTDVQNREVQARYNPMPIASLATLAAGIDWPAYLGSAGVPGVSTVVVAQPSAIAGVSSLMTSVAIDVWRDYLAFHVLAANAAFMPRQFHEAHDSFEYMTLRGFKAAPSAMQQALDAVNDDIPDEVGRSFVRLYFPPLAKQKAEHLAGLLMQATAECIRSAQWMSAPTKALALEKLKEAKVYVGYPDAWIDYSALRISRNDAYGNHVRAQQLAYDQDTAQLRGVSLANDWIVHAQDANAFANPFENTIVFPAGILAPPIFKDSADDAENFGSMGAIMGHEISHLFDDQGRKFDGRGRLSDWWTAADDEHFRQRSQQLVKQYDAYEPFPGIHINGERVLSENIADLAGLQIAYRAYHLALGARRDQVVDGLDGDQRFFVSFAQGWRGKQHTDALKSGLEQDAHAPVQYRALTVRNVDAWYDAFHVGPGDKLFIAKSLRVNIW